MRRFPYRYIGSCGGAFPFIDITKTMPTAEKCKDTFYATVAIGSALIIMFAFGHKYTTGEFNLRLIAFCCSIFPVLEC